jgi:3-oxoadipate enol-lactonase
MKKMILLALALGLASCHGGDQPTSRKESAVVTAGVVDVGDAEIHYERAGQGDALIMIHGGLLTKEMWNGHFELFAKKFRVIRYDARNHGLSRSEPASFAHFEDLNKLVEHLKIDRAVVMGLSMGGYIAADLALKYPAKVSGLILVAPGLSGFEFHGPESDAYREKFNAAVKTGEIEDIIEAFMEAWVYGPHRKAEDLDLGLREKIWAMARVTLETWNNQTKELVASPPAIEKLSEIKAPTLAIVGDLDMPNILEIVELYEKSVPAFEKVVIPGVAHMVNLEKPEEFNRAVDNFLRKVYGPKS